MLDGIAQVFAEQMEETRGMGNKDNGKCYSRCHDECKENVSMNK